MRPSPIPVCLTVAVCAVVLVGTGPARAAASPWNPAWAAALAEWVWTGPQIFDLPGARVSMQRFRAPLAPADAARLLTRAGAARFGRLQFSGPVLSLSGMDEGRHWLAQLRPAGGGTGTIGLLSSLEPGVRSVAGFDPVQLAPPGARPVLRAAGPPAAGIGSLASYLCPGPLARVAAAVRAALQARHWQPADGGIAQQMQTAAAPVVTAAGEWVRADGARLTVHLYPRDDAVVLTFWHRPKEPS